MDGNEALNFIDMNEEETPFYVIAQVRMSGRDYLLVTTSEDEEEAEAFILKDISEPTDEEAQYVTVEDDAELRALAPLFEEELEDITLEEKES